MQPGHIALVVAALACITDLRSRRIPNVLTFTAGLCGIAAAALVDGMSGATTSATGWLVVIAIFFPFFALGGLGAGDVKLLGAIGAWLGPMNAVWVGLYAGAAGGLLAIFVA